MVDITVRRKLVGFLLGEQGEKLVEFWRHEFPQIIELNFRVDRVIQKLVDGPDRGYKVLRAFLSGSSMKTGGGDKSNLVVDLSRGGTLRGFDFSDGKAVSLTESGAEGD